MGLEAAHRRGCFLLGSGPSLGKVSIGSLAGLDTLAFNRSYLAWEEWGFAPTYYACLDPAAIEANAAEIKAAIATHRRSHFFLLHSASLHGITPGERVSLVHTRPGHLFSSDPQALMDFGNVGATSMQLLALMGYRRIAMVGVDGRYARLESARALAGGGGSAVEADQSDYFIAGYAPAPSAGAVLDLGKILGQWPQVAAECNKLGLEVRNASSGSALACFPLIDFADAVEWVRAAETRPL